MIQALEQEDLMPQILVGSSAGSLIAAGLSTLKRQEVNIMQHFAFSLEKPIIAYTEKNAIDRIKVFLQQERPLGDIQVMKNFIRDIC